MPVRLLCVAALTSSLVIAAACGRSSDSSAAPAITLTTPDGGAPAYVEVTGLPATTLDALERRRLTPEQWPSVLRVAVSADAPRDARRATPSPTARCDSRRCSRSIRASVSRPVRSGRVCPGRALMRAASSRRRVGRPASTTVAFDRGRARLSDRRRRAGEPAAHVHRVLGTDGTPERRRVHEAAR